MYSGGGGVGGGGSSRIYNPRPDPLENGPPHRINRIEEHIGERVASSKKRIIWTFTLGESERVHEVVLVHSVMSYKRVVQFDGRQMHFDSTMTLGDWSYRMLYENPNALIEVRINEVESEDTPKYDLKIDRVPFWRWDIHRRKKQGTPLAMGTGQRSPQPSGGSFGLRTWGPAGMTNPTPPPAEPAGFRPPQAQFERGGFGGPNAPPVASLAPAPVAASAPTAMFSVPPAAPVPPQFGQQKPARTTLRRQQQQQQEIDLIGDYGPAVSMSAQELLFDPLASAKLGTPTGAGTVDTRSTRTQSDPNMATTLPGAFGRTPSFNGAASSANAQAAPSPAPVYNDPFANAPQPTPAMISSTRMNLDPLLATPTPAPLPAPMAPAAAGMPLQYPQYSQYPAFVSPTGATRSPAAPTAPYAPVSNASPAAAPGGVNFSISQLLDPAQVSHAAAVQQQKQAINIDPFAAMK